MNNPRVLVKGIVIEKDKKTGVEVGRRIIFGCWTCKGKFNSKTEAEGHSCSLISLENVEQVKPQPLKAN